MVKTAVAASIANPTFTITTTYIPANTTFTFSFFAKGSLNVDWGDGTVENKNNKGTYSHTYKTAGYYVIGMTGALQDQGQTTIAFKDNPYIEKMGGSLTSLFSGNVTRLNFIASFENCDNLTTISDTLFSGFTGNAEKFNNTFSGCSNLQYFETEYGIVNYIPDTMAAQNFGSTTFSGTAVATECPPGTTPMNAMVATCKPNQYTISYVMNGGTNFTGAPTDYWGGTVTEISGTPTYTGYKFVGWCDDAALTQNCAETRTISDMDYGNKIFYAKWVLYRSYSITYVLNGGANYAGAPTEYWSGTETIINGTPTKTDESFVGWCDDAALTQNCAKTRIISDADGGDKIFYAKWGLATCDGGYALIDGECVVCGITSWCADGVRHDCPTGLKTIGYGTGADEADDCGYEMHVGNDTILMRSGKKTAPVLNLMINDHTFYGNMTTQPTKMSAGASNSLKVLLNGIVYSVYDDSIDITSVN